MLPYRSTHHSEPRMQDRDRAPTLTRQCLLFFEELMKGSTLLFEGSTSIVLATFRNFAIQINRMWQWRWWGHTFFEEHKSAGTCYWLHCTEFGIVLDGSLTGRFLQAILIDMEEGVVNAVMKGHLRDLFEAKQLITDVSGSGNNWWFLFAWNGWKPLEYSC